MPIEIVRVPVLSDNYVWLVHEATSGETLVIDPAVAEPVLAAAEARGWEITQIWNTHWHPDHVGGNAQIKAATGCIITGPAAEAERISTLDVQVRGGDVVQLGEVRAMVLDVPAHTSGHIAYHFATEQVAFVGDTLFAMGCGRLFEGTAAQMYDNMRKLEALGDATAIYCAHEYTLSNARFAVTIEPDNAALQQRVSDVVAARERGEATVPTTIALERATNPFMRASSVEELAARRAAKDAA
jgi:hydroxyacylglutathione hydrolase